MSEENRAQEADPASAKLRVLLQQLKLLEKEKTRLYAEFKKRKRQRERQQQALEAERNRTEQRLGRLERILTTLNRAVERIKRIVQRLKVIQKQQEHLADEIMRRLEGRPSPNKTEKLTSVPRNRAPVVSRRPTRYPALPGIRSSGSSTAATTGPGEGLDQEVGEPATETADLTPDEVMEARQALLDVLQEIQSFRQKREEIEKEVDRLKSL